MGTPKYDDFDFAMLTDALYDLEEASKTGKEDIHHITRVFDELAEWLEVLQTPRLAVVARNISANLRGDGMGTAVKYESLVTAAKEMLDELDAWESDYLDDDLKELPKKVVIVPPDWTKEQLAALCEEPIGPDEVFILPDDWSKEEVLALIKKAEDEGDE